MPNKQLHRAVKSGHLRSASAQVYFALAPSFKRRRAAAELRSSASQNG